MNYPIPAVRVILTDEERKILFLQRSNTSFEAGRYCLPGGKVDIGKTLEQTCREEVKQETNLDISNLQFLFYDDTPPLDSAARHFIDFYFTAQHYGVPRINHESSSFLWIAQKDLSRHNIAFRNDQAVLQYWDRIS